MAYVLKKFEHVFDVVVLIGYLLYPRYCSSVLRVQCHIIPVHAFVHGSPLDQLPVDAAHISSVLQSGYGALVCRRVEPLQLALREGQLACAAVLIESGARINEGALRAVKLEPVGGVARDTR